MTYRNRCHASANYFWLFNTSRINRFPENPPSPMVRFSVDECYLQSAVETHAASSAGAPSHTRESRRPFAFLDKEHQRHDIP